MPKSKKQLKEENAILIKALEIKHNNHTLEIIDKSAPTITKGEFLISFCIVGAIVLLMGGIVSYLHRGINMSDFLLLVGGESFFFLSALFLYHVMKSKD